MGRGAAWRGLENSGMEFAEGNKRQGAFRVAMDALFEGRLTGNEAPSVLAVI